MEYRTSYDVDIPVNPSSPVAVQESMILVSSTPEGDRSETAAGGVESFSIALNRFKRPLVNVFLDCVGSGSMPERMRCFTCWLFSPLNSDQISAAAPATWGADIEVPPVAP